ncbi:MAG TPA: M20/M25/M40 family metallo-hydrolase [Solirubrobacteraceae bacterium]|nr:M20/M25/M40 family metallo-hydrolase [Solirubrobacteraceae bacterium]
MADDCAGPACARAAGRACATAAGPAAATAATAIPDGVSKLAGAAAPERERALSRLRALVEMDSPSGDAELLSVVCETLAARLSQLGARVERVRGAAGDHLRASLPPVGDPGSARTLLLLAHYDTVWPGGEAARRPFEVREGLATGPGVYDMKASLVMLELALGLLRDRGLAAAQETEIVILSDEEVSSPSGREVVMSAAKRAGAVLGLEGPHADGALKTARRGVATARLLVEGRESHAGIEAGAGVSATDELLDQLQRLRTALDRVPGLELNLGVLRGGTRPNVVAGRASADLGLRIATPDAERRLLALVGERPAVRDGASARFELVAMRPIWPAADQSALMAHVLRVGGALGLRLEGRPAPGAGDANFTGAAGIPTLDGLGPVGAGAHALAERVSIDSLLRRAELLAALLATPLPPLR